MAYDAHHPASTYHHDHDAQQQRETSNTSPYPSYDPAAAVFTDPRYYQQPQPQPQSPSSSRYENAQPVPFPSYDAPPTFSYEGQPPPPPSQEIPGMAGYNAQFPPPPEVNRSQPLFNAINHAFDNSSAANALPAEVISQITEQVRTQVFDSLRAEIAAVRATGTQGQSAQGGVPYNPGLDSARSPPPPAPYPSTGSPTVGGVAMPHFPPPPTQFFSATNSTGLNSPTGNNAGLYGSSPPTSTTSGQARSIRTPPTPQRRWSGGSENRRSFDGSDFRGPDGTTQEMPSRAKAESPKPEKTDNVVKEDLSQRYGERTRDDVSGPGKERPPARSAQTDDGETVIEKMWGPLFKDGKPTTRLGQFLRGIALHLVEEFEPKMSLVIGPKKMRKFYDTMKLSDEIYPFHTIFSLRPAQLSALYSSLSCQHHLIARSTSPYEPPSLPGLTPQGFQSWMTILILAHPNKEFDRLEKTIRAWAVCNADDRKERWPKELSLRLFPGRAGELEIRGLAEALGRVGIPVNSSFPPPPPPASAQPSSSSRHGHSASASSSAYAGQTPMPSSATASTPHASSFSSSAGHRGSQVPPPPPPQAHHRSFEEALESESSEDGSKPSIRLERERKPYVAKEGGGKIHKEHFDRHNAQSNATSGAPPPRDPPTHTSPTVPTPSNRGRERTQSNSGDMYSSSAPNRTYSNMRNGGRQRSPSYSSAQGYGRGSGDIESGSSGGFSSAYYSGQNATASARDSYASGSAVDEERYREYMERERREHEARYDEEYRKGGTYSGGLGMGNEPRRYG